MLVVLALDLFRRLAKVKVHTHEHQHDATALHAHVHVHMESTAHVPERHAHRHYDSYLGRALLVGFMHGSAGSAALILLVLQTISSKVLGIVYVIVFGVGATLGMALLSAIISVQLHRSHLRSAQLTRVLRSCAAVVTLSVGLFLMVKAGASAGLFTMI
jgi:ABC-type nickel/cobalt efflux system permease component RcnA